MEQSYNKWKNIIHNNYKGELNETALDILAASSLAIFIKNPTLAIERLPLIFSKLDILIGDEKVSTLLLKKYEEYPWNSNKDSESAMVVRALCSESNPVDEEWTMLLSTINKGKDNLEIIFQTVHELIHLLRFGGIVETDTEIKIKDGVSRARYIKSSGTMKRKHYSFEEGLVELYTKEVIENLYSLINSEQNISFSPILTKLKKFFNGKYEASYYLEVSLIEALSLNPKFKELIEETFEINDNIPGLITYYNNILGSPSAFNRLSKGLDTISELSNKGDLKKTFEIIETLKPDIAKIVNASKGIRK